MYSVNFFKNSIEVLRSPFPVVLQTVLLEEHAEGTRIALDTRRALERQSKDIWALEGNS